MVTAQNTMETTAMAIPDALRKATDVASRTMDAAIAVYPAATGPPVQACHAPAPGGVPSTYVPFIGILQGGRSDMLPDAEAAHDYQFGVASGAATRQ